MNKKIKVIKLFNIINENKNIPKKIKYNDIEYTYDENMQEYYACKEGRTSYFFYNVVQHKWAWLGTEVEILEDEEEIDIQELEDVNLFDNGQNFNDMPIIIKSYDDNFTNINNTINKLVQAVKQLDKKINKED